MTIKELEKRVEWKMLIEKMKGKEYVLRNLFEKIKPEERYNLLDALVLLLKEASGIYE